MASMAILSLLGVTPDSLRDDLLHGWVGFWVVSGVTAVVTWVFRGTLRALGKADSIPAAGRRYLTVLSCALTFFGLLGVRYGFAELDDIGAASPRKGRLHGNYILLSYMAPPRDVGTNPIPLTMSGVGVKPPTNLTNGGVDLLIVAKVDNSGQPSVAWNFKVSLTLPGGTRIDGFIPSVSISSNTVVNTIIGPYPIRMEDNLIQALATNPLPTGAGKIGWLPVHFAGVTEVPEGGRVSLTFEDVFGRQTNMDYIWVKRP